MIECSLRRTLVLIISLCAAAAPTSLPCAAQHDWTEISEYFVFPRNLYEGDAVLVDLDGANYMDVVMAGFESPPSFADPVPRSLAEIFRHRMTIQQSDPGVTDTLREYVPLQVSNFLMLSNADLAVADYNNDGRMDIAAVGIHDGSDTRSILLEQASDGADLSSYLGRFTAVRDGSLDWGDYNNDGLVDLLVTGSSIENRLTFTHLFQNQGGGGVFHQVETILPQVAYGDAVWGDSDNDGDLDVLITGAQDGEAYTSAVYLNENGSFVDAEAELQGLAFSKAQWADLNGDGLLDIVLAGAKQSPFIVDGRIYTYVNQGENTFSLVRNDIEGYYDGDLEVVDWDGDGDLDIAVSGYRSALYGSHPARFYAFEEDGIEELTTVFHTVDITFAPGDFDRDGDVDWFLTGFNPESAGLDTPTAAFYSDQNQPRNAAPTPPTNLSSQVSGRSVQMSWDPSTDDSTPIPSLTYSLRIGTTSGGLDVNSPAADPQSGLRYVCDQGNVFHNTSWPLNDLPPGTYYWSVQAVDNGCLGSDFASEGIFTVEGTSTASEDPPPIAHQLELLDAYPNPFRGTITFSFELGRSGPLEFEIFDMLGREVRSLLRTARPAGRASISWDGRDHAGAAVPPGAYLYRVTSGAASETGTVVLLP